MSNVGGALLVTGSITGVVATECSRCLDEVEYDVNGELEAYLIIPGESEAPEDMDEDEFDYLPESNQLDFEPILRAAVLVDLPMCRCVLKTARVCARNAVRTSTTALAAASPSRTMSCEPIPASRVNSPRLRISSSNRKKDASAPFSYAPLLDIWASGSALRRLPQGHGSLPFAALTMRSPGFV